MLKTFLIAHTNSAGTGIAQKSLRAKSERNALARFAKQCPQRIVTMLGVRGVEG